MIFNTNAVILVATVLVAGSFSVRADSIEIVDWDVSAFNTTDDGVYTNIARAFDGETVTWSGSNCPLVQFDDESAFESCNTTESTELSADGNYVFSVEWGKKKAKPRFYGCGDQTACDDGSKLKVLISKKKFMKTAKASCEGAGTETPLSVNTSFKGGTGKCAKLCKMTEKCFGIQYEKKTNPDGGRPKMITTCTLYDVYPEGTGDPGELLKKEKVLCKSVETDNTVGDD